MSLTTLSLSASPLSQAPMARTVVAIWPSALSAWPCGIGKLVAGDLIHHELIVGKVAVETTARPSRGSARPRRFQTWPTTRAFSDLPGSNRHSGRRRANVGPGARRIVAKPAVGRRPWQMRRAIDRSGRHRPLPALAAGRSSRTSPAGSAPAGRRPGRDATRRPRSVAARIDRSAQEQLAFSRTVGGTIGRRG